MVNYYIEKKRANEFITRKIDEAAKTKTNIDLNILLLLMEDKFMVGDRTILKRIHRIQAARQDFDITDNKLIWRK